MGIKSIIVPGVPPVIDACNAAMLGISPGDEGRRFAFSTFPAVRSPQDGSAPMPGATRVKFETKRRGGDVGFFRGL